VSACCTDWLTLIGLVCLPQPCGPSILVMLVAQLFPQHSGAAQCVAAGTLPLLAVLPARWLSAAAGRAMPLSHWRSAWTPCTTALLQVSAHTPGVAAASSMQPPLLLLHVSDAALSPQAIFLNRQNGPCVDQC